MSRRRMMPCKAHPELDRLLEATRNHVMTKEEIAAQRRSWVIGEMLIEHPEMTREYAERIYDEVAW